ncbi:flippase [Clostridium sp. D43t1_170807_H7]|uniref:flippase n=1 Tax=Clostridium sp. D43t1_170807_H7 TaxID=2787140 RepID=UPI001896D724|nr:flippase [Clostridium sp. D43t1_170807_H7]
MNKSISKNIFFKLLLNIFNLIIPILIGPYALRVLGPENMGTVNFSQTIYGYFYIFAGFGVYQYGLREVSRVRDNKEKLSSVFTNLFIFTLITNIITVAIYVIFIHNSYYGSQTYIACMIMTFNLVANVFYIEWLNEALENFGFITIKTIVVRIIYVILLLTTVRSSDNLKEYMIVLVLYTLLNNLLSFIYIKRRIKFNFSNIKLKKHIKPMFLVVILSNANVLYTQLDRLMLGQFVSTVSVAYYATAQNISTMINTLLLTVITVTIPRLSNYVANDSNEEYLTLLDKISKLYFLFLFPASIGMFLLSKEIILLYGGSEYMASVPIMMVFSLYIISLGYDTILSNQVMYTRRKEKQQVKIIFIGGLINLLLNILLVVFRKYNGTTAVATTLFANICVIVMENIYVRKVLRVKFNIFSMDKLKYMFVSLLFIPVTFIIRQFTGNIFESQELNAIVISLITVSVNGLLYFLVLFIIKDENLKEVKNKMLNKIKR